MRRGSFKGLLPLLFFLSAFLFVQAGWQGSFSAQAADTKSLRKNTVRKEGKDAQEMEKQLQELLNQLDFKELDQWLEERSDPVTFSQLLQELVTGGFSFDLGQAGTRLYQLLVGDYVENRKMILQVLSLIFLFSLILQFGSAMEKGYFARVSFLGFYLILMLLLLRLFYLMSHTVSAYFAQLLEFMQLLQPVFCLAVLFANGAMSAGVYCQLLLLLIWCVDLIFVKILLPAVELYFILQLVDHIGVEGRFSRFAALLSDGVAFVLKALTMAVFGLQLVQGLLAPGIDRFRRYSTLGAVRMLPGAGQFVNTMADLFAGSAILIKNSVGAAGLLVLVLLSLIPLLKIFVCMVLYKLCAAVTEPVADPRISAAVSVLGHSTVLLFKLTFYGMALFFLAIAMTCAATSFV